MFSEFELQLFGIAYVTLRKEISLFDNIGSHKEICEAAIGIEGFIQTKLIDAFLNRGLSVTMRGKVKRGADIIVEDIGVELKAEVKKNSPYCFKDGLTKHPKADLYLFLSRTDVKEALLNYFKQNGYIEEHKQLNPRWMIWVVKRK